VGPPDGTSLNGIVFFLSWVDAFLKCFLKNIKVFAFANNHHAGHAPATARQFERLLAEGKLE
jgi:hypothetical protein